MPHATFPRRLVALLSLVLRGLADGLLRPFVGSFGLLLLFVLPFDTWGFLQDSHGYARAQDLDVTLPHWERQYVQRNLLTFIATGLVLWLIAASYFQPHKPLLRVSCRVVVTALFLASVFNFYQWAMTGFDH